MLRRILCMVLAVTMMIALVVGCGQSTDKSKRTSDQGQSTAKVEESKKEEEKKQPVVFEVLADNPEYEAQEKELWSLYTKDNPHVTIKVFSVNEGQQEAFHARVAANNAPHFGSRTVGSINKENYQTYLNLQEINYPYWDELSFDAKILHEQLLGLPEGYTPSISLFGSNKYSFIYHEDIIKNIGVDPTAIKTWDDVDAFLAAVKAYKEKNGGFEYVLDAGWHNYVMMSQLFPVMAVSLGQDLQAERDLWMGKIAWDDVEKNPYVPVFKKFKEFYDKGYLTKKCPPCNFGLFYVYSFLENSKLYKQKVYGTSVP